MSLNQLIETIILGVIQGLTEWLPISSTGHLKLAERLLSLEMPILFDVILHLGTLAVVIAFFRKDIKAILSAFTRLDFKSDYGRFVPLVIVGTIPTALVGLVLTMFLEEALQNLLVMTAAFIACGIVLFSAKIGKEKTEKISFPKAIVIGFAQGLAIIPGLSRSGLTITVALLLGIKREKAFKFSFLLSIPAVIGALALTLYQDFNKLASLSLGAVEIAAGTTASLVVGYLALKLLWKTLAKGKLHFFAFYCWILGISLAAALFLDVF